MFPPFFFRYGNYNISTITYCNVAYDEKIENRESQEEVLVDFTYKETIFK